MKTIEELNKIRIEKRIGEILLLWCINYQMLL